MATVHRAAARPAGLHSSCSAATPRSRQDARRPAVSAAAAAPRAGDSRNTSAAASASFTADFVSCPWPRPPSYPSYQEPPASEQRRSIRSRMGHVVAKLMNGDTGALPPAVARLGGAFTDGCAVEAVEDGASPSSPSAASRGSSQQTPLLRAAARLWRYQGMR